MIFSSLDVDGEIHPDGFGDELVVVDTVYNRDVGLSELRARTQLMHYLLTGSDDIEEVL